MSFYWRYIKVTCHCLWQVIINIDSVLNGVHRVEIDSTWLTYEEKKICISKSVCCTCGYLK